jgi:hypothetical protein
VPGPSVRVRATSIRRPLGRPDDATRASAYLAALFRLIGFFNLILGTLGLLILSRFRATGKDWNLKIVVFSTIFAYVGPIVFENSVGTILASRNTACFPHSNHQRRDLLT